MAPYLPSLISQGTSNRGRRRKRPLVRWLLPLFSLVVVAVVAETMANWMVFRWGDPMTQTVVLEYQRAAAGAPQLFIPAPYVRYRLNPGFASQGGGRTRINAQGFRDDGDFGDKTSGTLRIVCLGGSTTFGTSVGDNDQAYPAALERELTKAPPPGWSRAEVFNLGVGGYTSAEVLESLKHDALALHPDAAIIEVAINDVNPRMCGDFNASYDGFRKPMQPIEFGPIRGIVARSAFLTFAGWKLGWIPALTLQARTQLPLPPADEALANLKRNGPERFRANLLDCVALARGAGVRLWLATEAYDDSPKFLPEDEEARKLESGYRLGLAQHNDVIRDICREQGVGLIDLDKLLPSDEAFYVDPIHLNASGYAVQAKLMRSRIDDDLTTSPLAPILNAAP